SIELCCCLVFRPLEDEELIARIKRHVRISTYEEIRGLIVMRLGLRPHCQSESFWVHEEVAHKRYGPFLGGYIPPADPAENPKSRQPRSIMEHTFKTDPASLPELSDLLAR
ncbi:MAG: hypothetical protein PHN75_15040, partial [Syntrophales bacterium]|nr:hypothetical protein [Syntrophales bacterium]